MRRGSKQIEYGDCFIARAQKESRLLWDRPLLLGHTGRGEAAKGSLSQLCSDRGSAGQDGQDSWKRLEPAAGQPLARGDWAGEQCLDRRVLYALSAAPTTHHSRLQCTKILKDRHRPFHLNWWCLATGKLFFSQQLFFSLVFLYFFFCKSFFT